MMSAVAVDLVHEDGSALNVLLAAWAPAFRVAMFLGFARRIIPNGVLAGPYSDAWRAPRRCLSELKCAEW
jgi:hypothetical protein